MSQPGDSPRPEEEEEEVEEEQQMDEQQADYAQAAEAADGEEEGEAPEAEAEGGEGDEEQPVAEHAQVGEEEEAPEAEAEAGDEPQAEEEQADAEAEEAQGDGAQQEPIAEEDEADAEADAEQVQEQEQHAQDEEAVGVEEEHAEGQPSGHRDGAEHDDAPADAAAMQHQQPEGAEGEAPAEADLDDAANDQQEQEEEAEAEVEEQEQAQETGDASFVHGETGDGHDSEEHKEQEPAETGGHTGSTDDASPEADADAEADAAAAPAAASAGEVEAEAEAQAQANSDDASGEAAPDFSHLSGRELAKAQALWAHTQRMAALERRLAEEEEMDRAETAAFHEERIRYLEEADQQFDDDAELLGSVQPLPPDEEALAETQALVEAARLATRQTAVPSPPSLDEVGGDDALVLDAIDLEEVRGAEAALENARVARLKEDAAGFLARIEALKRRDADAKARADALHSALLNDISKRRALLGTSSTQWQEQQDAAFLKAQTYLSAALETQKKLVQAEYGSLKEVKPIWPDGRVREAPQNSAPRILTLKVDCLRAIKNKLPGGFYVVLVTLYDRLGGHPLRWSKLGDGSGIGHSAMTSAPQRHGGKFYNLELSFQQESNLLTICCPSLRQARPNNVLLFELVSVRGGKNLSDRVLAWGAFPLMRTDRSLIRGRFKVPMLRGEVNMRLDKFTQLQERLTDDIDYWLCNLYFQTNTVPLRANYKWGGMKIESLQYKIDAHAMGGAKGGYFKGAGSAAAAMAAAAAGGGAGGGAGSYGRLGGGSGSGNDGGMDDDGGLGKGGMGSSGAIGGGGGGGGIGSSGPARLSTPNLPSAGGAGRDANPFMQSKYSRAGGGGGGGGGGGPAPKGMLGFGKGGGSGGGSGGGGGKVLDEFILPSDLLAGEATDLARKVAARERAKELRMYKHSLTSPEADVPSNKARDKSRFLWAEVAGDLGVSRVGTLEFWSTVGLFILAFWLRIYVHYFGQYIWLSNTWENKNAVYRFEVEATRCVLQYHYDPLTAVVTQSIILVIGVVSNQLALLGLMILAWSFLRLTGTFSDACFRFLLVYALNVLLDPLFIILIDLFHANWDGDYFKVYNAYQVATGRGNAGGEIGYAGAFLTLALAAILCSVSFVILFFYLTHLHMNGRMMDVFQRLHGDEGGFFVPNDLELSVRTLRYILAKSKKWTGFHGTRRKVLLTAYLIDDHMDRSFHERTLHLSIYNVTPRTGKRPEQRDIFRHFVRTADGAIIEAFEAVDSLGADGYQKLEERWLSQEATSVDEQEAEAEDLLKQMLSSQKRADAQGTASGSRARGLGAAGAASSAAGAAAASNAAGGASSGTSGGSGASGSAGPSSSPSGLRGSALPISPGFGPNPTSHSPDIESLSAHGGRGMSVVQELSERSDLDDGDPAAAPERDAQLLDQIGEEHSEAEEEDEENDG